MKPLLTVLFLVLLTQVHSESAFAQLIENRVSDLTALDRQYMDRQRTLINEMTLRYYGGRCCRSASELEYLERLLKDRHVGSQQTAELQAMGVLLGDLLASELGMRWVVYEDIKGRSRALRLDNTENYLFPVTMIARRREALDLTPIADIYSQAVETINAARPPLPFQ